MKTKRPTPKKHKKHKASKHVFFDEAALVASICRDSFYEFVKEFWDSIIAEPFNDNWHIKYLCDEFQKVAERVIRGDKSPYDLLINISPGSTKSTIFSIFAAPWVWTRMPSARFLCGSHTYDLVMDLSRKSRDVILEKRTGKPSYQDCFPDVVLRDDQNTKEYFMTTAKGFRKSVTVGGKSPTGFHAHFIIIDDPIDPQKAVSEVELKSANTWMNETLPSRKIDATVTPTILIMQRLHQDDPSGNLLAQKDQTVKHICLPATDDWPVVPPILKRRYVDGLMDPKRLPRKVLDIQRAKMLEYGYSGQYGQQPTPMSGGMFKVDQLLANLEHPNRPMKAIIRYWDKAATQGGGAYSVGVKLGVDTAGRFWILHVEREQLATDKREARILSLAKSDTKKVRVGIENEGGSGGKDSVVMTIKNLAGWRVTADKPVGDKIIRADAFSVQVNVGNVSMVPGEWNQAYIDELKLFPFSKFKDQVDASSGAFKLLSSRRSGALF